MQTRWRRQTPEFMCNCTYSMLQAGKQEPNQILGLLQEGQALRNGQARGSLQKIKVNIAGADEDHATGAVAVGTCTHGHGYGNAHCRAATVRDGVGDGLEGLWLRAYAGGELVHVHLVDAWRLHDVHEDVHEAVRRCPEAII